MRREINVLICFIAALFLITAPGDCCEVFEPEEEMVTECCIISGSRIGTVVTAIKPDHSDESTTAFQFSRLIRHNSVIAVAQVEKITAARLLLCVFRE